MDLTDASTLGIIITLFAVAVSSLLYFWPWGAPVLLDRGRKRLRIIDVHEMSHDTKRIRLSLGSRKTILGLPVGKHLAVYAPNPPSCVSTGKWNGKDDPDKGKAEIDRKYTPVTGDETPGYVDLVVKMYRPGTVKMPDGSEVTWADGGKMGQYLDTKKVGDELEITGPIGVLQALGSGQFKLPGRTITVKRVGMMAGGTGITPMLQLLQATLRDSSDKTTYSLIYANKTEQDILVRDYLDDCVNKSNGRIKVTYTLDFPPPKWQHKTGFITAEMIRECLPGPSPDTLVVMCGPPPMVEFACKKNLEALGYQKASYFAF
eukprot:gnl/TRDRNA2_/TRDRNA2_134496_c0_seq1.p1 gnl/TRDRNA2_/TRDRNA2_134496_c0~~gnl/TRDRNA2_/TRDRNA2_134496_c0_seq1.p1  ORF type:complete len:318 (+),score=54.13 gnl/TRDRNA2_/TRDRNA2_134496_c0_seq1:100-1053(+)